jgi:hypothetical protein
MASPDPITYAYQFPLADDDCVLQNVDDDHDDNRGPATANEDVENDLDWATMDDSASINLYIEIGSRDMIDVDEDRSLDLFIDIDPFLAIDNFVDQHS